MLSIFEFLEREKKYTLPVGMADLSIKSITPEPAIKPKPIDVVSFRQAESLMPKPSLTPALPSPAGIAKDNYRAAFRAGATPEVDPGSGELHLPSEFKLPGHPNRYVNGIDTITGKPGKFASFPVAEKERAKRTIAGYSTAKETIPMKNVSGDSSKAQKAKDKDTIGWLETIGRSVAAGFGDAQTNFMNIARLIHRGSAEMVDLILPDSVYKAENDKFVGAFDRAMEYQAKGAEKVGTPLQGLKGAKEFVSIGLRTMPPVVMSAVAAFVVPPALGAAETLPAKAATIPQAFVRNYPNIARMIPFGLYASGGGAMRAEQEGANYSQQVLAGVLTGAGEMATEAIPFDLAMKTIKMIGVDGLVESGAKTFLKRYGGAGINYLKGLTAEVLQEAAMEPIEGIIRKGIYAPETPWAGAGGVIDPRGIAEAGYGGLAMSVILGALGLPATARSHIMVSRAINENNRNYEQILREVSAQVHTDLADIEAGLYSGNATQEQKDKAEEFKKVLLGEREEAMLEEPGAESGIEDVVPEGISEVKTPSALPEAPVMPSEIEAEALLRKEKTPGESATALPESPKIEEITAGSTVFDLKTNTPLAALRGESVEPGATDGGKVVKWEEPGAGEVAGTETLESDTKSFPTTGWHTPVIKGEEKFAAMQSHGLPVGMFIALDKPFESTAHDKTKAKKVTFSLSNILDPDGLISTKNMEKHREIMNEFARTDVPEIGVGQGLDDVEKAMLSWRKRYSDYLQEKGFDGYVRAIDGDINNRELIVFDANKVAKPGAPAATAVVADRAAKTTTESSLGVDAQGAGEAGEKADEEAGKGEGTQAFAGQAQKLKYQQKSSGGLDPVKRRDIINHLSKELDIPIRIGRFTQKALGIFKVKPEVVRTRVANDLPVISHEVGHFLDKKLGLGDKAYDRELLALGAVTSRPSYTKSQIRKEGVAEFMRLYLTSPTEAQKEAPGYHAALENKMLANGDIYDVLLQARANIKAWMDQPAKARILGSVSVNEKKPRKMSIERLYSAAIDELRPLEKYVKDVAGEVDIEKNPFLIAWLGRGWVGKAETFLHYGVVDESFNKIGPGLNETLKPVTKDLDNFRAYIIAKRAEELHGRGKRTGIEDADAKVVISELETPEFKEALSKLVKYQDAVVDELIKAGVISKDAAITMRKLNQNYVPFYRVFEEEMGASYGFGKGGFANIKSPIRRLKGSERDIVDPLESIIKNTFYMINVAERNKVGRAIVGLADKKEGSGKWVERLPTPMHGVRINLNEVKESLEAVGVDTKGIDLDKVASVFRPNAFPAGKENILTVYRGGNKEYYQLDPELYRATLALDKESSNLFVNLLSLPAKTLRAGATLTPEFMARNPVRDIWEALIYSKYGFNPIDFAKGLFHSVKKDDIFWKWQAAGGAHGAMVSLDRDYLQGSLRDLLATSVKDKSLNIIRNPLEVLRALSEFGEQATRIGEFAKGLKYEPQTKAGIMHAALASRDVTLDFSRIGYSVKIPNRVFAFFNANVQDIDKIARSFRANPGRSLIRSLLYITLPSILLYFRNRDDERYQEIPQWQKDIFWIIPTQKRLYRIPKPFTLGMLFGTFPERVLQYIDKQDPKAFDEYFSSFANAALPELLPTALVGWVEAYMNKSFYTGRPIVPRGEESMDPELQYGHYTTETAKLIGRAFNVSPRKADHVIRSYGGGLATHSTKILDKLIDIATKEERPAKVAPELADYPLISAFVPRMWASSDSIDKFYNELNELEMEYKSAKKRGYTGKAKTKLSNYRSVARDLSKLRKTAQDIYADKKLSASEKREKTDTLNLVQVNMARKAIGKAIIKQE